METPAAKRSTLILLAGIIWSAVGIGLAAVATVWFTHLEVGSGIAAMLAAAGLIVGTIWYKMMFQRLVAENIDRIESMSPHKERICIFAFQNIRSYLVVVAMMTLGYLLRTSGLTKVALAPGYLSIASALFLGSLRYYNHLRQNRMTLTQ